MIILVWYVNTLLHINCTFVILLRLLEAHEYMANNPLLLMLIDAG